MNKLVRACIALAAFAAFAVLPASAMGQNDATVTEGSEHKTVLATGTNIVATGHNTFSRLTDVNGNTLTQCTTAALTGPITRNDHTAVEGNITAASFVGTPGVSHTGHCFGSSGPTHVNANPATNGLPWCLQIRAVDTTDHFRVRGNECSKAARPIRFTVQITTGLGPVHCEYERSTPITGTYTTGTNSTLKVSGGENAKFTRVSGICPSEAFLDLEMTVYRDTGFNAEGKHITDPVAIINAT